MKSTAEYLANPVRQHVTTCRRCGVTLTTDNARRYSGRCVGACRKCEMAEQRERNTKQGNRNAARALRLLDDIVTHEHETIDGQLSDEILHVCDWLDRLAGDWA